MGGRRGATRRAAPVLAVLVLLPGTACLPELGAPPASTLPAVDPSTTRVADEDDRPAPVPVEPPVESFTGQLLSDAPHTLRSDDPMVPFVDGRPAEIGRIAGLVVDGDCEQLFETLEFWIVFVDDDEADQEVAAGGGVTGPGSARDDLAVASRRASLYSRAAFDALVDLGCG